MLEDPDALMANAEVQRIIAEGAKDSDVEIITETGRGGETASREGARPNGTAEKGTFASLLSGCCGRVSLRFAMLHDLFSWCFGVSYCFD